MPRGEGTKKLSSLFDKYKKTLKAPQGSVVKEFCEIVSDVLDIDISKDKVSYIPSTKIISLKVGGPLKSEIMLHKKEILNHLKGRLGEQSSPKDFI